jgi:PAS domain S-box-containing protein
VAAQVKEVRRVLIFYDLGLASPAIELLDQQIRIALEASPFQVELYREYLQTDLFPDPVNQQEIRTGYIRKYRDHKPGLIIAIGEDPLNFMVEVHEKAFPEVPIVFSGAEEIAGYPKLDHHFTGVWERFEPGKTLEVAVKLLPNTKHVVIVGGTSDFDRGLLAIFKKKLSGYEDRFDFIYLTDFDMPTLLQRLKHLPENTVILYTHTGQDAAGTRYVGASQSGPMIARAANAPIFGPSDVDLGYGGVGGYLESFAAEGKLVGEAALRILNGTGPQDIPIVEGANVYVFDWRALRRWGLKETNLPPGSTVLNRQPTLWESFRWYVIGGMTLILAEALLISGLLWQRTRRKAAETKLTIANKQLEADIADRKRAESTLRESEERFRLVANTAPVTIWMSGPDKLCTYLNHEWLEFTGQSLSEEMGDGWGVGLHPEDLVPCLETYEQAFDRREPFQMQYRLRRHDGEYRWVIDHGVPRFDVDGSFAGYIGSCIDITERKLADEALAVMSRKLLEAQEQERTRIGRELHDDINQRLSL